MTPEDARLGDIEREFLRELTELSHKHRLGIVGPFDLFVMEDDDQTREYRDDGRGKHEFF